MSLSLRIGYCSSVAVVLPLLISSACSAASIMATTPNLQQIAAPASVLEGALEDTNNAFIFREQRNLVLPQNLFVDATNTGAFIDLNGNGGVPGIIPAGTAIDSFYIHYDPVGQPTIAQIIQWAATWQFADRILGLIYSDTRLDNSDFVGAPGTVYPNGVQFRGTTGTQEGIDDINWNGPFDILSMQSVTVAVDQIRVILAVPEPTGLCLWACSAVVMIRWRSRDRSMRRGSHR